MLPLLFDKKQGDREALGTIASAGNCRTLECCFIGIEQLRSNWRTTVNCILLCNLQPKPSVRRPGTQSHMLEGLHPSMSGERKRKHDSLETDSNQATSQPNKHKSNGASTKRESRAEIVRRSCGNCGNDKPRGPWHLSLGKCLCAACYMYQKYVSMPSVRERLKSRVVEINRAYQLRSHSSNGRLPSKA